MKKSILYVLSGILSLSLVHAANAVTIHNDTGEKIYIHKMNGDTVKLLPGQYSDCCYGACNKFNVLIDNPKGKGLTTVCTINPVDSWDNVRIAKILNYSYNGGCYSYYRYMK